MQGNLVLSLELSHICMVAALALLRVSGLTVNPWLRPL